jgi:hypothetical protein
MEEKSGPLEKWTNNNWHQSRRNFSEEMLGSPFWPQQEREFLEAFKVESVDWNYEDTNKIGYKM